MMSSRVASRDADRMNLSTPKRIDRVGREVSATARLLGWWQRVLAADRRHPRVLDAAVALLVLMLGLPETLAPASRPLFAQPVSNAPSWILLTAALLGVVPLLWRRRWPEPVYAVAITIGVVQWQLGLLAPAGLNLLVTLYGVAAYGMLRWLPVIMVGTAVGLAGLASTAWEPPDPLVGTFLVLSTAMAAVALGLTVRVRRAYLDALEERAYRLEVDRDRRAELATTAERVRIAREMHDLIGHHLTVIVSLSEGGAAAARVDPARAVEALGHTGRTARAALTELRLLLGVLRDNSAPRSPQPGTTQIEDVLHQARAAGQKIVYRSTGTLSSLSPGLQLSVHRIVQEAVTNTLRHAPGSTMTVVVEADADDVQMVVENDGPAISWDGDEGYGLPGMRERALLHGGRLASGPRVGGGWRTEATLPITPLDVS